MRSTSTLSGKILFPTIRRFQLLNTDFKIHLDTRDIPYVETWGTVGARVRQVLDGQPPRRTLYLPSIAGRPGPGSDTVPSPDDPAAVGSGAPFGRQPCGKIARWSNM